jgi:hypothetical protein
MNDGSPMDIISPMKTPTHEDQQQPKDDLLVYLELTGKKASPIVQFGRATTHYVPSLMGGRPPNLIKDLKWRDSSHAE